MELSTAMLLAALSTSPPPAAAAQPTPAVIVRAPERLLCRPVARTGTRIGTSAMCRTRADSARAGQYVTLDDADAKLLVISSPCDCD